MQAPPLRNYGRRGGGAAGQHKKHCHRLYFEEACFQNVDAIEHNSAPEDKDTFGYTNQGQTQRKKKRQHRAALATVSEPKQTTVQGGLGFWSEMK